MADLLTKGCIEKLVSGECPESFTVQLLLSRKIGEEKFRLLLTDGEDKFKLAVFDRSKSGLSLPGKFSIISVSVRETPANVPKPQMVLIKDTGKFSLLLYYFTVLRAGEDVDRSLLSALPTEALRPQLETPPRSQCDSNPREHSTPVKARDPEKDKVQGREGFKRKLENLYDDQPASSSKVPRQEATHQVSQLNPYSGKVKMKVMVESKGAVRQVNTRNYTGSVQDCILTDSSGSIKLTAWNTDVTQMDSLQQGKTYMMETSSNKITPVRDSKYNSTNHPYEMTWDRFTKAEGPITVDPVQVRYNFTNIHELTRTPVSTEVDILAWVKQVLEVEDKRTSDGRDLRMREVLLADNSAGGSSVSLILWNQQAEDFRGQGEIIAIKKAILREFRGTKNLNLSKNGSYEISPVCPGAEQLKQWASNLTEDISNIEAPSNHQQGGCDVRSIQEIKDLLAHDNNEKKFTVYGVSHRINTDNMWYRAHRPSGGKVCRKKVQPSSPENNSYNCKCGDRNLPQSETELRYMVNLCISDSTSHAWAIMFDAESLFGMTAQELQDKKDANESEFNKLVSDVNFTTMKFSLGAKVESFNGSPKLRVTLHQAERVWTEGEEGMVRRREMLSLRWKEILQMEREIGISHEEEFGIDIPGLESIGNNS